MTQITLPLRRALLLVLVCASLIASVAVAPSAHATPTLTLSPSQSYFSTGTSITWTATASAATTGYRFLIRDDTDGVIFADCPSTSTSCSFFRSPSTADQPHVFRAYIANRSGNALVDKQAESAPVTMEWMPFSVSLSRMIGKNGGELTAVPNQHTGSSGQSILIYNTTTGALIKECTSALSCTQSFVSTSTSNSYRAYIGRKNATFPPTALATSDDKPFTPFGPTVSNTKGGKTGPAQKCVQACVKDPINTATGVYWEAQTDLAVPGRGPAFAWTRNYSAAMSGTDGPLGFGWTHQYAVTATVATGTVTISQENGSEIVYTDDGVGGYIAPSTVLASLTKLGDGTYRWTRTADRLTYAFSSAGRLTGISDRNNETTTLGYTSGGALDTITDPAGRTATLTWTNGRISKVTDSAGREVAYTYDTAGNLTGVLDARGQTTAYTYDGAHRVLTRTDPRSGVVTNVYDTVGRITSQTDPSNKTATFAYSTSGALNLTDVTDERGNTTRYYYWAGVLVQQDAAFGTTEVASTVYSYDANTASLTAVTDPNGNVTTSSYDTAGRLVSKTDALGSRVVHTYDTQGDLTTTTDPLGVTTTRTYDSAGNLLQTTTPLPGGTAQTVSYQHGSTTHPGDVTSVTDPRGKTTTYAYNTAGDLTSVTDPLGRITTHAYDGLGRRTSTVAPRGNETGGTPANHTLTYTYDAHGHVLTATDQNGHTTTNTYDGNGNLSTVTGPDGETTTTTYDANNRPTQVTRPDLTTTTTAYDNLGNIVGQTDAANRTTTYTFDKLNRATTVTDPLSRVTTTKYDKGGRRTERTDAAGKVTRYTYNAANQLTLIDYNAVAASGTTNASFTYDKAGRRTKTIDAFGTTNYTYDTLGRLTVVNGGGLGDRKYDYDLAGNITSVTYPTGQVATRGYDDAGQWTSVTDWTSQQFTFGYDADGNLTSRTNPNGTNVVTAYDNAGAVTSTNNRLGTTSYASFAYTRDNADRVTQLVPTGTGAPTRTHTYTDNGRLATEGTSAYAWDAGDNLTGTPAGDTITYDAANQVATRAVGGTTTSYAYSASGNRTQETVLGTATRTLAYDSENRMTSHTASAVTTAYVYDADGLRGSKKVGAGTAERFAWDVTGSVPMLLMDATNVYLWGPDGQLLEQKARTGGTSVYPALDAQGSIHALTSQTGAVVRTWTYSTFGQRTAGTGTASTPFGYTGEYTDGESTLLYLRARYYDSLTGSFLTVDPLRDLTRDLYGYANGNPLTFTDPLGLFGWDDLKTTLDAASSRMGKAAGIAAVVVAVAAITVGTGGVGGFVIAASWMGSTSLALGVGAALIECTRTQLSKACGTSLGKVGLGVGLNAWANRAYGVMRAGHVTRNDRAIATAEYALTNNTDNLFQSFGGNPC